MVDNPSFSELAEQFYRFYELRNRVSKIEDIKDNPIYLEYRHLGAELMSYVLTGEEIIEAGIGDFTKELKKLEELENKLKSIGKVRKELIGKNGEFVEKLRGLLDS